MLLRGVAVAVLSGLALLFVAGESTADHAPPAAGTVDVVAIDVDPTGNTPTSVSAINTCRTATVGQFYWVDIVVDEVHSSDLVSSLEFDFLYDATLLRVALRTSSTSTLIGQAGSYLDTPSDPMPDSDGDYLHNAFDLSGPHEAGEGILVALRLEVIGQGVSSLTLTDNIEMDGEPNIRDANDNDIPINQVLSAQIRSDGSSCEPDDDADGWVNSQDNCRYWYNPSQSMPVWTVPAADSDCDGFPDTVTSGARGRENFIGSDAADHCPDTVTANDEQGPVVGEPLSPWPPDINDTRSTNLSDVVVIGPSFNKSPPNPAYSQRMDLNASSGVNLSDVVAIGPFFNRTCSGA